MYANVHSWVCIKHDYFVHNILVSVAISCIVLMYNCYTKVAVLITRGPSFLYLRPSIDPSTSQTHTHTYTYTDTYTYLYMCMILCVYVVTWDYVYCISRPVTDLWDNAILSSIRNDYRLPIYICAKPLSNVILSIGSFLKEEPSAVGTMLMHERTSSWNVNMVTGVEGIHTKNRDVAWLYAHGKCTLVYVDASDNMGDAKQCKYIFM